ncbi:MAG: hypothetical protein MSG64_18000, partial [Pyrinomonadaceae bacterium MAG19_C2-C3]|nr:hypothetical protein [Pyrinomonadaceae bacterium MAG19_C2-C3]
ATTTVVPLGGQRGQTAPQFAPLSDRQGDALSNAFNELRGRVSENDLSKDCRKNVIDKLKKIGFDLKSFGNYLYRSGANFADGSNSQIATSAALAPSQILQGTPPPTIAGLFAAAPGITALTSANLSANSLTVFFRTSAIDLSNSGVNSYNQGLLFHEALHGYGSSVNGGNFGAYSDKGLLGLFGLNTAGPSSQITAHIQKHCF